MIRTGGEYRASLQDGPLDFVRKTADLSDHVTADRQKVA